MRRPEASVVVTSPALLSGYSGGPHTLQWLSFDTTAGETQVFAALWHQSRAQVYGRDTDSRHAQQFDALQLVPRASGGVPSRSETIWNYRSGGSTICEDAYTIAIQL